MSIMRIDELRKASGLSQVELASSVGIAQSTLSMWESEHALPRTRDLPRLAKVLGCTIDDLFSPEDPEDNHNYISDLATEP